MITASEPSWTAPFYGLSPRALGKLVTLLRRQGADAVRKGRPWGLPLENRALPVAAYWRTNLTMHQLAPLFGVSKSAADRIVDHLGPLLALQPRKRFAKDTVLIVDGTQVPTRDHTIAERSKNYRYSTNHQVVIDARHPHGRCGRPTARREPQRLQGMGGIRRQAAVGKTLTIADGGYPGTGLVIPHRRERCQTELPAWKEEHDKPHKQVRVRVEHVFARMKTWKILRDCRLKGAGVHCAMLGIARMRNLALAGLASGPHDGSGTPQSTRRSFTGQQLSELVTRSCWCGPVGRCRCDDSAVRDGVGTRPWTVDDELWALIEPLLPPWPERSPGPRPVSSRHVPRGAKAWQWVAAPKDGFHVLRHTYASIMLEAGESVVTLARWLGHSSPVITLGYYAHFMPEAGSKGRGAIDGLLGKGGASARQSKLPRFCPASSTGDSRFCTPQRPSVDCKAEEMGGLGKCCKKS